MQKKLLAVAVAGALAAPAAAMAQSAVTIYGTLSMSVETAQATGGDGALAATQTGTSSSTRGNAVIGTGASQTAGAYPTGALGAAGVADLASRYRTQGAGSNFGIRVREDLGGSMYTWLQAELTIQATGVSPVAAGSGGTGPTYRNTGLAIGSSAWGDVVLGMWDTPYNVNMNPAPQHAPYANASTNFSSQLFGGGPWGGSQTNSGQALTAVCTTAASAAATIGLTFTNTGQSCIAQAMSFHRRQSNTIQYWSPSWSGFQVKAMYGVQDLKQADNLAGNATGTANAKTLTPSMWSGSLTYSAGPLYVGFGYEKHTDFSAFGARTAGGLTIGGLAGGANAAFIPGVVSAANAAGVSGSKDTAWNLNARYTFGAFTIGAYYEAIKWSLTYEGAPQGGELSELKKKAYGLEGAFVTGPHTLGIRYAKAKKLEGSTLTGAVAGQGGGFNGDDTGAQAWIFGYAYSLSKRTSLFGYHTRVSNDSNARYQGIVFSGLATASGGDPKYTGVGIRHTF